MGKDATSETSPGVRKALHLAMQFHQKGSLGTAEILYRRILKIVPNMLDAVHFLGLVCCQQGKYEEAAELIRRIISIDPDIADAHNNLGNVLKELKQYDNAAACYQRAIALRAEHSFAYSNLGVVLLAQDKTAEAVDACRKAVELAPSSVEFRCNLGSALRKSGDTDTAARTYREAIKINPQHKEVWQALTDIHIMAGRRDLAVEVCNEWLSFFPGDESIIFLRNACRGADAPSKAPESYVQQVFNDMAESFDTHLERLDYQAPRLLCEALAATMPRSSANLKILDAGCGTGLCGPLLRPHAGQLTGVDLSSGMLSKAKARSVYDDLIEAELTEFVGRHTDSFDIIASTDTLCYFGDLEPVFQCATRALKPGGYFGFTLEALPDGESETQLNHHGRYSHSRKYVETALAASGLKIHSFSSVFLRNEGGKPVAGHLVVAMRQTTSKMEVLSWPAQ